MNFYNNILFLIQSKIVHLAALPCLLRLRLQIINHTKLIISLIEFILTGYCLYCKIFAFKIMQYHLSKFHELKMQKKTGTKFNDSEF